MCAGVAGCAPPKERGARQSAMSGGALLATPLDFAQPDVAIEFAIQ
jgi:hypothetical protein